MLSTQNNKIAVNTTKPEITDKINQKAIIPVNTKKPRHFQLKNHSPLSIQNYPNHQHKNNNDRITDSYATMTKGKPVNTNIIKS